MMACNNSIRIWLLQEDSYSSSAECVAQINEVDVVSGIDIRSCEWERRGEKRKVVEVTDFHLEIKLLGIYHSKSSSFEGSFRDSEIF